MTLIAKETGKSQIVQLADEGKQRIARAEFAEGIEQSIQLGIVIGKLTKSEDLTKSFQALKAVNDACNAVSAGMTAFGSASTSMGQVGAIAGAATGVVGAVIVISSLMESGGKSADQAILESLQELKTMIVHLSDQIEAGFKDSARRTDRIEALLESYSNLASKNIFVLQQEVGARPGPTKGHRITSAFGRYCCKSRKSNNPKNLAKADLWTSLLLRRFSTPLRRSVIDFG
jgi:hypothetical protein